jgi:aryl-phospho-beta-D-glucosidase BglC (GH1 family)
MKIRNVVLGLLALSLSAGVQPVFASSPTMFGTNLSGGDFGSTYPGTLGTTYFYPSATHWDWAKSQGLELVRMPFRWERVQYDVNGVLNNFLNSPDIVAIDAALDLAESRGMRVILDMHNYAGRRLTIGGTQAGYNIGSAQLPNSAYADAWRLLADHFKNRSCIWGYDIMNEPVSIGVTAWVSAAQAAVTAIRQVDTTHAIILEGYFYAHTDSWLTNGAPLLSVVDPSNNLIFSGHIYPDRDGSGTWTHGGSVTGELVPGKYPDLASAYNVGVDRVKPFVDWCVANNVRGLIGEFATPATNDTANWNIVLDRLYDYIKNNSNNLVSTTQWGGGAWNGTYVVRMEGLVDDSQPHFMVPVVSNYASGAGTNWWFGFNWYDDAITTTADYTFPYAFASTSPAATCTFSIADTTTFYSGAKSAALNYTIPAGGYAGAGMHIRGPLTAGAVGGVDISKSVAAGHVLSFYAKGTPGATPTITLGTTSNGSGVDSGSDTGTGNWISIAGIAPLTSSWQHYEIPLSSFLNTQITGAERIQRLRFTAGPADGTAYQVNFDKITIGLPSTNTAPSVTVDTSTGGNTFGVGQSVTVVSTATDGDAGDSIDYVEFYANHEKIGIGAAAPFQFTTSFATAGTYDLTAIAFDSHGVSKQSAVKTITITSSPPVTINVTSTTGEDGWVLESTSTSGVGGSLAAGKIRVGDDASNRQYVAILSFDTSAIPDGATITSATLQVKRDVVAGTDPFTTHGSCNVSVRTGGFNGNTALEAADLQAAATAANVATMSDAVANGNLSTGVLNAAGRNAISKTGKTQIRLSFTLGDNADGGADYLQCNASNDTVAKRPTLIITYQ